MKYVKVNDLQPHMILAQTLYDDNETVLLAANKTLTEFHINRIKKLEFDGLYVFESEGDIVELKTLIDEKTKVKSLKALKHLNIDECLYLANLIVEEIRNNESHMVEMMNLSSYDNYTYMHSINVNIYSVILGIALGLNEDDLKHVSQAALLHDIGKTCIDINILNKPGKLTKDEFTEMKEHSKYGYNIVKVNENIASVVRNAIYSHHENEDGTGYPRQLKSDKIHKFAKIIHIADVYDALTSKRSYKDAMNPADAMDYLVANAGTMFDREYVLKFISHIAPYPIGTEVELSNGEIATVIKNHESMLTRPLVRLKNGSYINLLDTLNVTIVKLLTQ